MERAAKSESKRRDTPNWMSRMFANICELRPIERSGAMTHFPFLEPSLACLSNKKSLLQRFRVFAKTMDRLAASAPHSSKLGQLYFLAGLGGCSPKGFGLSDITFRPVGAGNAEKPLDCRAIPLIAHSACTWLDAHGMLRPGHVLLPPNEEDVTEKDALQEWAQALRFPTSKPSDSEELRECIAAVCCIVTILPYKVKGDGGGGGGGGGEGDEETRWTVIQADLLRDKNDVEMVVMDYEYQDRIPSHIYQTKQFLNLMLMVQFAMHVKTTTPFRLMIGDYKNLSHRVYRVRKYRKDPSGILSLMRALSVLRRSPKSKNPMVQHQMQLTSNEFKSGNDKNIVITMVLTVLFQMTRCVLEDVQAAKIEPDPSGSSYYSEVFDIDMVMKRRKEINMERFEKGLALVDDPSGDSAGESNISSDCIDASSVPKKSGSDSPARSFIPPARHDPLSSTSIFHVSCGSISIPRHRETKRTESERSRSGSSSTESSMIKRAFALAREEERRTRQRIEKEALTANELRDRNGAIVTEARMKAAEDEKQRKREAERLALERKAAIQKERADIDRRKREARKKRLLESMKNE